jgi:hypothetical protein
MKKMEKMNDQELADEIIRCIEISKAGMFQPKSVKRGNYYADRSDIGWDILRKRGLKAKDALVPFLQSDVKTTRGYVAALLSKHVPELAIKTLKELEIGNDFAGFSAHETLKRIAEGATWDP